MTKTRAQLQEILNELEASIPEWQKKYPDESDFTPVFAEAADQAMDHVSADDYDWLSEQLDAIQRHYKITPYLPDVSNDQ